MSSISLDAEIVQENPWVKETSENTSEPADEQQPQQPQKGAKTTADSEPSVALKEARSPLKTLLAPPSLKSISSKPPTQQHVQRSPSKKLSLIEGHARDLIFGVCIVNFHHLRGPELELSKFSDDLPAVDYSKVWPYMPFQALPDGAHVFEETFSYFTLYYNKKGQYEEVDENSTTLFGISCVRQIRTEDLLEKDDEFTRSSVQKAVVVILRQPIYGQIKEKLSVVTKAFFEQKNFSDTSIVDVLYQNLETTYSESSPYIEESDFYSGLSLRSLIKELKRSVLVILKAMLLEHKLVFYCSNPTKLCLTEFAFISLIPNLINNMLDCSSPLLDNYAKNLKLSTSFKSSDRNSVLDFAGLPLQIFGKGGIFSPFSPLQQFDELKKLSYYMIGTSNALILNQKSSMADVLVNLDNSTVEVLNQSLIPALALTSHDKKWISSISADVSNSWTDGYSGFLGSDDNIRWQFEDYLTAFLSCVKYDNFLAKFDGAPPQELMLKETESNHLKHFNTHFVEKWKETNNYKLFNDHTDDHIFDIFEPKHVYLDDVKSLSEKFQQFKQDNAKKFDDYRKSLKEKNQPQRDGGKEQIAKSSPDLRDEKLDAAPHTISGESSSKKLHSPGKIWSWYNKKTKEQQKDKEDKVSI